MAYTYPAAPVGAIFLLTCRYQMCGQILRNQFHFRLETNTNTRTINTVCDAIHTKFKAVDNLSAKMRELRDVTCVLLDTGVQQISPSRFAGVGYLENEAGNALNEGASLTQLAAVLTRRSVVATRRGVSSLHLPLANKDTFIDLGVLTADALAKIGQVGNAILNFLDMGDGITVRPIIYHRGAVPLYDYIETFIVQPQVRIMRRRTVGLGE